MKKRLFKIIPSFIIIASIFCGCGTNQKAVESSKQASSQEEKVSEYSESDKPWGEYNYKKVGVIKDFEKNYDDNFTTAVLSVDGEGTTDKLKIYGTDIDVNNYKGKSVFISAVKKDDVSRDFILVKRHQDINLVDSALMASIKTLNSIDNNNDINKVKGKIDSISNTDHREYFTGVYNNRIKELNEKKVNEDNQRKAYEKQQADKKKQEQEQAKQKEQQANENRQANENVQTNGQTVYIAASGKGKKYHNDSDCSNMNGNVNSMSRSQAEQNGYSACKKCYR